MPARKERHGPEAEALHHRLLYLVDHGDLTRTAIAEAIGRHPGTVSPWFARDDWYLPDAKGLMGLLRRCTIGGARLSPVWLLCGEGGPTDTATAPGPLFYRGAQIELAELELWVRARRDRLRAEEARSSGPKAKRRGGRRQSRRGDRSSGETSGEAT